MEQSGVLLLQMMLFLLFIFHKNLTRDLILLSKYHTFYLCYVLRFYLVFTGAVYKKYRCEHP